MNFREVVFIHEFSEKLGNCSLESHDSMVCWNSQINNSVVKSDILLDDSSFNFAIIFDAFTLTSFILLIGDKSGSIFNLERKHWGRFVYGPDFLNL